MTGYPPRSAVRRPCGLSSPIARLALQREYLSMFNRISPASERDFDVVLYGATGFVGRQTVAYFARHAGDLRWALAGRDGPRLQAVRAEAAAAHAGIVVAAAHDAGALDALAARTHVVLSTAGPFARFGSPLVAACVKRRTHYVDITGETAWVRGLIDAHHEQAAREGTRIIPCCGFDSVPSDLGAWMVAQALRERGEACVCTEAAFSMRGGLNGGTLASALHMLESGQDRVMDDPYLLHPAHVRRPNPSPMDADPNTPHHDPRFKAWLGPFVMGRINTRVVRRSAALLGAACGYDPDFHYQEYLRVGRGGLAAAAAGALSAGMAMTRVAQAWQPVRRLTAALLPAPGEGPSEATMNGGWFRCDLIASAASGATMRARVAGQGDPGNRATTRFVCEAALALACDQAELAGNAAKGGVLTPASGLGAVLVRRLRTAGMTLETLA